MLTCDGLTFALWERGVWVAVLSVNGGGGRVMDSMLLDFFKQLKPW